MIFHFNQLYPKTISHVRISENLRITSLDSNFFAENEKYKYGYWLGRYSSFIIHLSQIKKTNLFSYYLSIIQLIIVITLDWQYNCRGRLHILYLKETEYFKWAISWSFGMRVREYLNSTLFYYRKYSSELKNLL